MKCISWFGRALPIVLATVPLACASGNPDADDDDDDGAAATLVRSVSCEETVCSASFARCLQTRSECTDTCAYGRIEDASLCFDICRDIECEPCAGGDTSACIEERFSFTVTGAPNARIRSACERYYATCHPDSAVGDCEKLSRIARPAFATVLECAAERACGDIASCLTNLPVSDLGQAVCGLIEERCSAQRCSAASPTVLDDVGAWLRDDAAVAALDCAAEDCASIWPCLDAWQSAIL